MQVCTCLYFLINGLRRRMSDDHMIAMNDFLFGSSPVMIPNPSYDYNQHIPTYKCFREVYYLCKIKKYLYYKYIRVPI